LLDVCGSTVLGAGSKKQYLHNQKKNSSLETEMKRGSTPSTEEDYINIYLYRYTSRNI
jgi:hypothetical protein